MDGGPHFGKAFLDLVGNAYYVDLDTPTGGARNKGDAAVAQFKRTQDLVGHGNLFFGLGTQAHTNSVTDAIRKQESQANRGFHRTCDQRSSLRNTQVERIV